MELQGEDGSVVELSETLQKELGRGPGVAPHDRTVSRRQVRLQLSKARSRLRVSVEVIGANPICLIHSNGQVQIAKPGTQSSLEIGDKLSLSIQDPVFYTLQDPVARAGQSGKLPGDDQGVEAGVDPDEEEGIAEAVARWQRRKQERLQTEQKRSITQEGDKTLNLNPSQVEAERKQVEDIVSEPELVPCQHEVDDLELTGGLRTGEDDTDVVKKFGFVVEGSEFERYGKRGHDTSKWEWQIGPRPADDSDEDDEEERTGKRSRISTSGSKTNQIKARRATKADDDDDWQGDSEGEKELLSTGKRRKNEAQTRSRDLATSSSKPRNNPKPVSSSAHGKTRVNSTTSSSTKRKKEDEEEEDDDDGEDLDGFLVDDVEEEDESEAADDEDEWTDDEEDEEVEDEDEIDEGRSVGDDKPLCKYGNKCFRKNKDHLAQFRH